MRRNEFEMTDKQELDQFLNEMSFGFLGTSSDDDYPSITPLNFVYCNDSIYFHGSRVGEKMTNLAARPKVTFNVAKEYAVIPSYFTDPVFACPATSFFKSVIIYGQAVIVEDLKEKALVLQALMTKLQPEGGHKPITGDDPEYRGRLKGVSIVRIDAERIVGKFKFGQNKKEEELASVVDGLLNRDGEYDAETIELMRKYCPHFKSSDN
ncbi:pyridoxamine 5'-phosphate oxidase family protein [Paenibacillus sp. NEAU-GSW1]|uniref:pyridoxamine 5'-phosphate oxidase family protein n=1 Tax=Paenibacillus sp. NEAU-GSW1 TaxID=2682486 RepID=UPI0012E183BF|nr:pyridoxamine 5'-phosphate oxidase family protein [Paenibacillus sp. NEAU-GSW1]MUT65872.1 flavin-nucleotide-binding protein [Paenibacillus sp. NEAU-GSW1]